MSCTCSTATPAGVAVTIDGTQYYVASGTQTVAALIASISSGPNFLSSAINGFRNTTTNVSVQGLTQNITINGGESLLALYGPF